ncbi:hypothetical protein [Larkinella arboricola]|uniref:Uncharacterized protein n=1 Tax=Larkinella arboricola TaxID=643671 RepID=A0A327WN57_LARAB|nr:hypothetical protein [Larkinella arboricola]RAJ92268.1 hypothetical protein LX87_05237 [Larkinella arboricola]
MKKYILLVGSLAVVFAVATLTCGGFLSFIFGMVAFTLAVCAAVLSSHAQVDANNNPIPKEPVTARPSRLAGFPI